MNPPSRLPSLLFLVLLCSFASLGEHRQQALFHPSFTSNDLNGNETLQRLPSGHILVQGNWTLLNGEPSPGWALLDSSGQLLSPFAPSQPHISSLLKIRSIANQGWIAYAEVIVPDNTENRLLRYNAAGELTASTPFFVEPGRGENLAISPNSELYILKQNPDWESHADPSFFLSSKKLDAAGSLVDNPSFAQASIWGDCSEIQVLADGSILIVGTLTQVNEDTATWGYRFEPSGLRKTGFSSTAFAADYRIERIQELSNGNLITYGTSNDGIQIAILTPSGSKTDFAVSSQVELVYETALYETAHDGFFLTQFNQIPGGPSTDSNVLLLDSSGAINPSFPIEAFEALHLFQHAGLSTGDLLSWGSDRTQDNEIQLFKTSIQGVTTLLTDFQTEAPGAVAFSWTDTGEIAFSSYADRLDGASIKEHNTIALGAFSIDGALSSLTLRNVETPEPPRYLNTPFEPYLSQFDAKTLVAFYPSGNALASYRNDGWPATKIAILQANEDASITPIVEIQAPLRWLPQSLIPAKDEGFYFLENTSNVNHTASALIRHYHPNGAPAALPPHPEISFRPASPYHFALSDSSLFLKGDQLSVGGQPKPIGARFNLQGQYIETYKPEDSIAFTAPSALPFTHNSTPSPFDQQGNQYIAARHTDASQNPNSGYAIFQIDESGNLTNILPHESWQSATFALNPNGDFILSGLLHRQDSYPSFENRHYTQQTVPSSSPLSSYGSVQHSPFSFKVTLINTSQLPLQWFMNGTAIPGQTSPILSLPFLDSTTIGSYQLIANSGIQNLELATLDLIPGAPPSIPISHPVPFGGIAGSSASLTLSVSGDPSPELQWFKNGVPIPGATSNTLTLPSVAFTSLGDYRLRARNGLGESWSPTHQMRVSQVEESTLTLAGLSKAYLTSSHFFLHYDQSDRLWIEDYAGRPQTQNIRSLSLSDQSLWEDPKDWEGLSVPITYEIRATPAHDGSYYFYYTEEREGSPDIAHIHKVHSDGSIDPTFSNPKIAITPGAALQVFSLGDGSLLFHNSKWTKYDASGTLVETFNPSNRDIFLFFERLDASNPDGSFLATTEDSNLHVFDSNGSIQYSITLADDGTTSYPIAFWEDGRYIKHKSQEDSYTVYDKDGQIISQVEYDNNKRLLQTHTYPFLHYSSSIDEPLYFLVRDANANIGLAWIAHDGSNNFDAIPDLPMPHATSMIPLDQQRFALVGPTPSDQVEIKIFSNENLLLDTLYSTQTEPSRELHTVVLPSDKSILVSGDFIEYQNTMRAKLMKLDKDGDIDPSFNANPTTLQLEGNIGKIIPDHAGGALVLAAKLFSNSFDTALHFDRDGNLVKRLNIENVGEIIDAAIYKDDSVVLAIKRFNENLSRLSTYDAAGLETNRMPTPFFGLISSLQLTDSEELAVNHRSGDNIHLELIEPDETKSPHFKPITIPSDQAIAINQRSQVAILDPDESTLTLQNPAGYSLNKVHFSPNEITANSTLHFLSNTLVAVNRQWIVDTLSGAKIPFASVENNGYQSKYAIGKDHIIRYQNIINELHITKAFTSESFQNYPHPKFTTIGENAILEITPDDPNASLSFKWYKDGAALPGESESRLTIVNANETHSGNYSVKVTAASYTFESDPIPLTVGPSPYIDTAILPNKENLRFLWTGDRTQTFQIETLTPNAKWETGHHGYSQDGELFYIDFTGAEPQNRLILRIRED